MSCDASDTHENYLQKINTSNIESPLSKKYSSIDPKDFENDILDLTYRLMKHECKIGTCRHYYKDKLEPCRFHFPKELSLESKIEYKQDIYNNGNFGPWQCIVIIKRINDTCISNFNKEQLFIWRGNADFSLLNSFNKVEIYVTKYTAKSETPSSTFDEVFTTIIDESNCDFTDTKQVIKKIMTKVMGLRDVTPNEAMHTLLGYELHNSNVTVIKTSLNESNLLNKSLDEIKIDESYLHLYSNRVIYGPNIENIENMNFNEFVTNFRNKLKNKKLDHRINLDNTVLRIYQYYSSNKSDPNYWLFCKYELLRYKPWMLPLENVLEKNNQDNEQGNIKLNKKLIFYVKNSNY